MIFNENQVTLSKLAELFDNAYLNFEKGDNKIVIKENGLILVIRIDEDKKMILMYALMTLTGFDMDSTLKIINKVNGEYILVKFYLSEDLGDEITLAGDYRLSYESGLIDRHLISSIKTFIKVFSHVHEVEL